MSNLLDIPKITYNAAYRAQSKNNDADPYVLFAWQRMCEILTKDIEIASEVNMKDAPVQGFIKKNDENAIILCMTLRQKFCDVFWFTLFHEIAHILNGDTRYNFVDFDSVSGEIEKKADRMAGEFLMNSKEYKAFVDSGKYRTAGGIDEFAQSQGVKDYIVKGRLMKEELIPWTARSRYEWA